MIFFLAFGNVSNNVYLGLLERSHNLWEPRLTYVHFLKCAVNGHSVIKSTSLMAQFYNVNSFLLLFEVFNELANAYKLN